LNSRHPNIKFTVEYEIDGKIPFLDVLVNKTEGEKFSTSIFRKNTFTGLLMNFTSFCTISYKRGLVRTLVDRAFKINSSWPGFHCDLTKLTAILKRNQFPDHLLSNSIKTYLQEKLAKPVKSSDRNVDERSVRYFKLPYVGFLSTLTHQRIRRLVESHCKGIVVKLVFSSFKTGSYFSSKDRLSKYSRSGVVYKFTCAGCNASYIGETARHINTRIEEHLGKDKASHVWKHLRDSECKNLCSAACFSVLDSAATDFQRRLKEAMHIHWLKPNLNAQINHLSLSLSI
jgi:hypothetical protein